MSRVPAATERRQRSRVNLPASLVRLLAKPPAHEDEKSSPYYVSKEEKAAFPGFCACANLVHPRLLLLLLLLLRRRRLHKPLRALPGVGMRVRSRFTGGQPAPK